jgi:hypothetical protein
MSSPDPDLDTLDPRVRPIVERLVERKRANKLPRFSRRQACEIRGVSESKQIRDEKAGEVLAYVSDGKVYIDPDSIFDKMTRDAIASFPPGKPPAKIRRAPTSAFARKKRPRTEAQLAALREHNDRLHREAKKAAAEAV